MQRCWVRIVISSSNWIRVACSAMGVEQRDPLHLWPRSLPPPVARVSSHAAYAALQTGTVTIIRGYFPRWRS
jgi:hypothetical protein